MLNGILGSSRRYLLNFLDRPAVVLLYHRVTLLNNDPQQLAVSPDNFYEQIGFLKKNCCLLKIEEFSDFLLSGKKLPPKSVVITFDDGYLDNYHEALPILESHSCQALFYITTGQIDTRKELWWDELERILLSHNILPREIAIQISGKTYSFPTNNSTERKNAYDAFHPLLKFAPVSVRDKTIAELQQWAGLSDTGRSTHRLLTSAELVRMNESSAAVLGAHTVNHPALSVLIYEDQLAEIDLSRKFLENVLKQKIEHFSYPYGGKNDYNKDTIKACREIGFKLVCANKYNQVHSWSDIFQVPRILIRNWDKHSFSQYIPKFFQY